jgi:hypothetical protein
MSVDVSPVAGTADTEQLASELAALRARANRATTALARIYVRLSELQEQIRRHRELT